MQISEIEKKTWGDVYDPKVQDLLGRTFTKVVNVDDEELILENDTESFTFYHDQDCCEYVSIESITGDLNDLINSPILFAEESVNEDLTVDQSGFGGSGTWTFYKLATVKGWVDIRWYGESNGYYSESVNLSYNKK